MTTITVDLQIVQLINCIERIIEVERTLCRIDGVKLLYVDYNNAKFTIETTLDPEEIRGALQHMFVGTAVLLSGRSNAPNPSVQNPVNFLDGVRELVEGFRGKGLANVEYTRSTNFKMKYTNQPTTSRATDVRDPELGGYAFAPQMPPSPSQPLPRPQQQYEASTSGSAMPYGRYGPPPSAPPMPMGEGEDYVSRYPTSKNKYMGYDHYSGEDYVSGYSKTYMEEDYSGGCSTVLFNVGFEPYE
ncbi:hypothetical protein OSB04_026544 [Centaurea solstitialis]|uniref:Uncharacterized protein n=1 Tax=Centaurea solstitialis TaxID=347529 RepID=A0AA38SX50_9ASTR|nr:hypothetical protein OSB04_026544 [Centaurea solstitialis]